jgi:hypothetical protein
MVMLYDRLPMKGIPARTNDIHASLFASAAVMMSASAAFLALYRPFRASYEMPADKHTKKSNPAVTIQ